MIIIGVKKLAEHLGVSSRTIYRYMDKGMPHGTIGHKKKTFDIDEVKKWLMSK